MFIYKSNSMLDDSTKIWIKLADFDKINEVGANTGLQHQFVDHDVIAGYGYNYAVTAYDRGIPDEDLPELESSKLAEKASISIIAGGPEKNTVDDVYVYPNPFVGSSQWARVQSFNVSSNRILAFANLPAGKSIIKIFNLAGDLINTIEHNTGESIYFWDMTNKKGKPIVSGIYLYTIESEFGTKIAKFVVLQ